jgi:hypothetical protein
LRQVFAAEAQQVVLEHARALAVAGKSWSAVSLRSLLRRLRKLHVRDASKRRGRMSQFTGPLWVERVLESRANLLQFQKAGACLGQVFDTSAIAEDLPTVDALCVELKTRSRLPLVGKYSVPHLVRACSAARQHLDGTLLILGNDGWSKHMRTMHETRTTNQFQLLHVQSHADAVSMLRTVVHTARSFYTSRTATPFGRASLIDLPCQVCELAGVLGSVKSYRCSLANAGSVSSPAGSVARASTGVSRKCDKDVEWLLARLPGSVVGLKQLSKSLKLQIAKVQGRGNGLDLQCSGNVTKMWLRSSPSRLRRNLLDVLIRRSRGPFHMPPLMCSSCHRVLDVSVNCRLALCTECRKRRRQQWDARRQRARRNMTAV